MTVSVFKQTSASLFVALLIPALANAIPPKLDHSRTDILKATTLQPSSGPANRATAAIPVYQPPFRGATQGGRVGGGTRGLGNQPLTVDVLAPDHTGLTVNKQPTLYWFVSQTINQPVELTIIDNNSIDPLLEIKLSPPIQAGIHSVPLATHGVQLEPLVPYQWFVGVVVDPDQRSNDIIAGGEIQLVSESDSLRNELLGVGEDQRPAIFAQAGIWYDAIDGASTLIKRNPSNVQWKEFRAALLEQVGLDTAGPPLQHPPGLREHARDK